MGKRNTDTKATTAAVDTTATTATTAQAYVPSKAYKGKEGTKHGVNGGGTAGTFAALVQAAQANGGTLSLAEAKAICKANGDPGFAAYAVKQKYLLPVQPA